MKTLSYFMLLLAVVTGVAYLNFIQPVSGYLPANINFGGFIDQVFAKESARDRISTQNSLSASEAIVEQLDATSGQSAKPITVAVQTEQASVAPEPAEMAVLPETNDSQQVEMVDALPEENENTSVTVADLDTQLAMLETKLAERQQAKTQNIRVLLMPSRETTLSSTVSARIVRLKSGLGQRFSAGSALVSFDCDEANARVDIAKATLAGAIEEHEAKIKMQGLDQASDVEVALAATAVNKAKAELSLNRTAVSNCRIYAPWSGRIAKAHVNNSMTVTPGQPLLEIVDTGPLKIKLNVPSKLLSELKQGSVFKVTIDETGQTYDARIKAINSRIDSVSQTVEVEARMNKAHKELLAGMSGTADFTGFGVYQ